MTHVNPAAATPAASAPQLTFRRTEAKYLLAPEQRSELAQLISERMTPDEHGPATVRNVYFDTPTALLARRSAERPAYKEKIRTRCYGAPAPGEPVFLELKKKCDGVVYKRRVRVLPSRATALLAGTSEPRTQIEREIAFAASRYEGLGPMAYLAYDREAFFSPHDRDFRMTLDADVRVRWNNARLDGPDTGQLVLARGISILEVKTGCAMPLWLCRWLSERGICRASVSKYGRAWQLRGVDELLPHASPSAAAAVVAPSSASASAAQPAPSSACFSPAHLATRTD